MTRTEIIALMDILSISGKPKHVNKATIEYTANGKKAVYLKTKPSTSPLPLWLEWYDKTFLVNISSYKAPIRKTLYYMVNNPDRLYKVQKIGYDIVKYSYGLKDYETFIKRDFQSLTL